MIRVQDVLDQKDLGELTSNLTSLRALVWSPDGNRLAALSGRLHVWDIRAMRSLFVWQGVAINSLAWASDSLRSAVAGTGDPLDAGYRVHMGYIHVFDVERRARLLKVQVGRNRVPDTSVAWNPRGTFLTGGNDNGLVMVWETGTGRPVANARMHRTKVRALDWSPDGRRVASVSDDGMLKVWDDATGDELLALTERGEPLTAAKWSSAGNELAVADVSGRICVWDASVGYEVVSGIDFGRLHARMREQLAMQAIETVDAAEVVVQISRAIELASRLSRCRRCNRSQPGDWLIFPALLLATSDSWADRRLPFVGKNVPVPLPGCERLRQR